MTSSSLIQYTPRKLRTLLCSAASSGGRQMPLSGCVSLSAGAELSATRQSSQSLAAKTDISNEMDCQRHPTKVTNIEAGLCKRCTCDNKNLMQTHSTV